MRHVGVLDTAQAHVRIDRVPPSLFARSSDRRSVYAIQLQSLWAALRTEVGELVQKCRVQEPVPLAPHYCAFKARLRLRVAYPAAEERRYCLALQCICNAAKLRKYYSCRPVADLGSYHGCSTGPAKSSRPPSNMSTERPNRAASFKRCSSVCYCSATTSSEGRKGTLSGDAYVSVSHATRLHDVQLAYLIARHAKLHKSDRSHLPHGCV